MRRCQKIFLLILCIGICFFTGCSWLKTYSLKIEDIEIAKDINLADKIVFTKWKLKKTGAITSMSIWLMDINGENQICLVKHNDKNVLVMRPVFSPDSKKVAFIVNAAIRKKEFRDIFMINTHDKETLSRITYDGKSSVPIFSPDGEKIFFMVENKGFGRKENMDIYMTKINDREHLRIKKIICGSKSYRHNFSPDRKKILFIYSEPYKNDYGYSNDKIYLMDIDDGDKIQLVSSKYGLRSPSFSSNGQRIIFSMMDKNKESDIYLINSDGTNLVRLTSTSENEYSSSFSPNGTKIVFEADKKIYIMSMDGKNKKLIFEYQKKKDSKVSIIDYSYIDSVAFSPDGEKIIFVLKENIFKVVSSTSKDRQFEAKEEYDYANIYTIGVDGNSLTNLTNDKFSHNESPRWCPVQESD